MLSAIVRHKTDKNQTSNTDDELLPIVYSITPNDQKNGPHYSGYSTLGNYHERVYECIVGINWH